MVQTVNIETFSDADFVRRYVYRTVGGVPIDLGLGILRMMVRTHPNDAITHLDLSSLGEGIIITDAAQGAFTLSIPVSVLASIRPGVYVHSLILTDTSYRTRQDIWRGTFTHSIGPSRWKTGTFLP